MNKTILLYFPYDLDSKESGSRVRPNKIIESFKKLGYDFILVEGNNNKRKSKIKTIIKNEMDFLFCYSEPSTYPVHPFIDYKMYYYLKKKKIPVGIFYRDAYWKFNSHFQKRGIKKIELLFRYWIDLYLFDHVASVIFFPTESLRELFHIKSNTAILPPGGEKLFIEKKFSNNILRGIYVGGISSRYGINILLDAFDLVNKKQRLELIIVCRKNEYNVLDSSTIEKIKRNWIKVYHVSGDDLKDLYYKSDFGIIPRLKDDYNIIAMPVKLFEYLSYGIPIVATNCLEMEKFINKHQCGVICEDNSKSLAEAISKINNKEYYEILCNNAQGTILDGNLWADRVKSIVEIMTHDQNS